MNFTVPATSKRIITIVVATLAIISTLCISTLSYCLIFRVQPDTTLMTAYVGITTGSLGALTALLANTRTTPSTDADMPKGTVTTSISSETTEKLTGSPAADKPTI